MMRRRITMALLPIMYKLGVSTTLLGVLVFIGIKTAAMVSVLFVLALGSLAKHKFGAFGGGGYHSAHWSPPPAAPVQKEVHVHVHADPHKQVGPPWYRKQSSDEYESVDADPYGGPYGYGPSGYASPYEEPQPQVLYRAPYRRWPTARSRPSTATTHTSPWSSAHPQLAETVPAASASAPAYAMHPRWTWQRYMEQEYPLDLAKTLHPEKVKGSH